jgi:hypothetical protein
MAIPFVIDNQRHRMADALNELLAQSGGEALDIATAYFAVSGYRMVNEGLHQVGALRLILGSEPHAGANVGFRPSAEALIKWMQGDLEGGRQPMRAVRQTEIRQWYYQATDPRELRVDLLRVLVGVVNSEQATAENRRDFDGIWHYVAIRQFHFKELQ